MARFGGAHFDPSPKEVEAGLKALNQCRLHQDSLKNKKLDVVVHNQDLI